MARSGAILWLSGGHRGVKNCTAPKREQDFSKKWARRLGESIMDRTAPKREQHFLIKIARRLSESTNLPSRAILRPCRGLCQKAHGAYARAAFLKKVGTAPRREHHESHGA